MSTPRVPAGPADRWTTLDRWSLAYAAYALLVTGVRWPAPLVQAWPIVLPHLVLGGVAWAAPTLRRAGRLGTFVGEFYALILALGLYTCIGILNRAAGIAYDWHVLALEQLFFGCQPAHAWIRAQPWPWLSVLLHSAYFSYYSILVGTPLALWSSGRRAAARHTLQYMMVAFYICYAVFLVFPVAGPRYAFAPSAGPAKLVLPARVVELLLVRADAWGTAFPSSHVAVAVAAAIGAWRGWRLLGAGVMPLALLLAMGTVYGQFHYALDALAGLTVAAVVTGVGCRRGPRAPGAPAP